MASEGAHMQRNWRGGSDAAAPTIKCSFKMSAEVTVVYSFKAWNSVHGVFQGLYSL